MILSTARNNQKLFWIQFTLIIIASTHYLSIWFFLVPVSFGLFASIVFCSRLRFRKDIIHFFFFCLLLGYTFRSASNGLLLTIEFWKDLILILYNYAMVQVFQNYKMSRKDVIATIAILLLLSLYFFIGRLAGVNVLILAKFLFSGSSYHIIAWFGLILVGFVVISQGANNLTKWAVVAYFILCLLLGGRTGIFIAAVLLAVSLSVSQNSKISFRKVIFSSLLMAGVVFIVLSAGADIFKDIIERGASFGPREFIWLCYFNELNTRTLIFGFDKNLVAECVRPFIGRVTVESSFFSLQLLTGAFSIVILSVLVIQIFKSLKVNFIYFFILIIFCFRLATGEFVFITTFDWLFLTILLKKGNTHGEPNEKIGNGFR